MSAEPHAAAERLGGTVELHYIARAGLLPELSRQTYDSLWKAVREAVLNAVDASATRIELDLSRVASHGELEVADNGSGMTTREFCEQFMSVGGSSKFGEADRFGRIGIGALALLQYGRSATVETKRAGSNVVTRARINHAWDLGRRERREHLDDLVAGSAEEFLHDGDPADHFTRVRILGVNDEVASAGSDINAFYALLERLRRVLPLPWADGALIAALRERSPALVDVLEEHVVAWSAPVVVHSAWERDIVLTRRVFGDDPAGAEVWSGPPVPVLKTLRVPGDSPRRKIVVAGYLLNQRRASTGWMGLTARVQNVAVEEHSFFDVTADPGFRKYIHGEIWLLGDVDRERLINIDRASFSRECADYQVAQRFLARSIVDFKFVGVQRPQRAKVAVRRRLEQHQQTIAAAQRVVDVAAGMHADSGLPASGRDRPAPPRIVTIADELRDLAAVVADGPVDAGAKGGYNLDLTQDGTAVAVALRADFAEPRIDAAGVEYRLQLARGGTEAPPIVVRNRPRRIVVNLDHPSHEGPTAAAKIQMGLALELAYLFENGPDGGSVYDRMLRFLEAL